MLIYRRCCFQEFFRAYTIRKKIATPICVHENEICRSSFPPIFLFFWVSPIILIQSGEQISLFMECFLYYFIEKTEEVKLQKK